MLGRDRGASKIRAVSLSASCPCLACRKGEAGQLRIIKHAAFALRGREAAAIKERSSRGLQDGHDVEAMRVMDYESIAASWRLR